MTVIKPYQICTKTIMDTSDPNIVFNANGESDYYTNFVETILPNWHTDRKGLDELMKVANRIKAEGNGTWFDPVSLFLSFSFFVILY